MTTFLSEIAGATLQLFVKMAPYLLLGLTVAGLLNAIVRREFVASRLGGRGVGPVIRASLLGVPLPLCSCGVVPTARYLSRAGASRPAIMSFLISTPQTGVDSIAATWGMLGPLFAVFRPLAALVTGVLGGLASGQDRTDASPSDGEEDPLEARPKGLQARVRAFTDFAYRESLDDIALQFLFGLAAGGVIAVLLPPDFFVGRSFGSGLPAMLLMVLVGIPMYVCSTSSIPIAVALIAKGLSPGAAYVFLVAGPATNAATLAVLSHVLGRKQTVIYVATLIGGSLVFGPLMERLTSVLGWVPPVGMSTTEESPGFLTMLAAVVLGGLIAAALWRRWRPAPRADQLGDDTIAVGDMTCTHCARAVEAAVRTVPGIERVDINLDRRTVRVAGRTTNPDWQAVRAAIQEAGYDPGETPRSRSDG